MSKEKKQTEIEQFEDSITRLHDRRKLRDFGIDDLDSKIDEINKCEKSAKPFTSSTEQEKVDNRNVSLYF